MYRELFPDFGGTTAEGPRQQLRYGDLTVENSEAGKSGFQADLRGLDCRLARGRRREELLTFRRFSGPHYAQMVHRRHRTRRVVLFQASQLRGLMFPMGASSPSTRGGSGDYDDDFNDDDFNDDDFNEDDDDG